MVCFAPRALVDSVRPRRLDGGGRAPLNFTVRFLWKRLRKTVALLGYCIYNNQCA